MDPNDSADLEEEFRRQCTDLEDRWKLEGAVDESKRVLLLLTRVEIPLRSAFTKAVAIAGNCADDPDSVDQLLSDLQNALDRLEFMKKCAEIAIESPYSKEREDAGDL